MDSFLEGYAHVQEPIYDTYFGEILGYELLVRERLSGSQFSGAKEVVKRFKDNKQIQWLDAQGVRKAVDSIVTSDKSSLQMYSCNVSRFSLEHREFEEYVEGLISDVNLEGRFYLDIMDMKFSYMRWQLLYAITRLADKGAKFILGTIDMDTLSVLDEVKFSYVKIQQKQIAESPEDCVKMVRKIEACGAFPVAVGVESQEDLEAALGVGIRLLQGYYIEMPQAMPNQAFG